jgi:hypothetical protein
MLQQLLLHCKIADHSGICPDVQVFAARASELEIFLVIEEQVAGHVPIDMLRLRVKIMYGQRGPFANLGGRLVRFF